MALPALLVGAACRPALAAVTIHLVASWLTGLVWLEPHFTSRSSVKIKAIEPLAVSLPMKKPVQMAGGTVAQAENVFVRIESDAGVLGRGGAATGPPQT